MIDKLLCIDPGTKVSGAVIYHPGEMRISTIFPEIDNNDLLIQINNAINPACLLILEMVSSYGKPVGKEVFETVLWTGRMMQTFGPQKTQLIYRRDVKLKLCGDSTVKDSNVRRALLDLFPATGGGTTPQVGTKAKPGPLYGLKKHAVHALAAGIAWSAIESAKETARGKLVLSWI